MPEEKRRVVIEKSSTVRRRYQRSNKVFKFTAEQIKRIERDEAREKRAKDLREKDKKRVANKKKKAEEDARLREEQRRNGPPDPESLKFPSSQQLLSRFMGFTKPQQQKQSSIEPPSEVKTEFKDHDSNASADDTNTDEHEPENSTTEEPRQESATPDADSAEGDTEVDSDEFDDLDEELEQEMSVLESTGPSHIPRPEDTAESTPIETKREIKEPRAIDDEEDEFSDCSAFNDEDLLKEAHAAPTPQPNTTEMSRPLSDHKPAHPRRQPAAEQPKVPPTLSLGDSFRDETADYLEDVFARGCGDSFSELIHADMRSQ